MRIKIYPWNLLIVYIDGRRFTIDRRGILDWCHIKNSIDWSN